MSKLITILKRLFIFSFLFFTILAVSLYTWLNLRLDQAIDKNSYDKFVENIQSSQDLPDRFHDIYNMVNGFEDSHTATYMLIKLPFQIIFKGYYNSCPCMDANYPFIRNGLDRWTVALALDRDVTPRKCTDYYLSKMDFLHLNIGIQKASRFYYNKEIKELTDKEMLGLSLMAVNPSIFNKRRYPERLKREVQKYEEIIKH